MDKPIEETTIPSREEIILRSAIDHFGDDNQFTLLMEECAELIQAVNKLRRTGNTTKVIEEIADVELMIAQAKLILGDVAVIRIDVEKQSKLNRLEKDLKFENHRRIS